MAESKTKKRDEEVQDAKSDPYSGFNATDRALSVDNPEYGAQLSQIKRNYNAATTDEERKGWHDEAEKLSNAYGYSRSADGSRMTRLASNLNTIKNYDSAYGKDDKSGYQAVINALLGGIAGAKFQYDAKSDPRYALAQDYAKDAMQNQMAESAALTGGYGNSYSAALGQQVYNDYMDSAVDNLEDRAYSRFRDEQNDRYQRLNTLIGLEGTAYNRALERENTEYNRAETAKATAQARLRTFFEDGGSVAELPEYVKTASGYTDAEIAAIYQSAQESRSKDASADARDRVDAFISNGGDPTKLSPELLAASGYTDAEIAAAREYVLESIRRQNAASYSGSKSGSGKAASGNADTDGQAAETGDAEGLFLAAYAAGKRAESDMAPEEYIAKNYKAFGFDSANGLVKQYQDSVDENGVYDISQDDATQYLINNGIAPFVISKSEFYKNGRTVGGKKYDSYADFIDDLVLTEKRQGFRDTAKTGFRY